jgi:hypothetical protein
MMWTRRTCLHPALRCLGEAVLQNVCDPDDELGAGERARNPITAAVGSVLVGVEIIVQLWQGVLVGGGLGDPETQPVHVRDAGSDDGELGDGLRALEILEDRACGLIEPVRWSALVVHEVNATDAPRTSRSTKNGHTVRRRRDGPCSHEWFPPPIASHRQGRLRPHGAPLVAVKVGLCDPIPAAMGCAAPARAGAISPRHL